MRNVLAGLLAFAMLSPAIPFAVQAQETEESACISIEIVADREAASQEVQEAVTVWSGAAIIEAPPVEETEPVSQPDYPRSHTDVPLYFQTDYPNVRYGSGSVATSGCSITCLAMVATYMTGHTYTPDVLADYFGGRAYSNMARMETGSDVLQLPYRKAENWHESLRALKEGNVVIALVEEASLFTSSQHFIVLTGMTEDEKILVNDPYKPNYDRWDLKNGFANGFSEGDILCGYSGGWIYDKDAMPEEPFIYYEEKPVREYRYPDFGLTIEETELLARVVWVEARGECFEGQQAVAEVVLNRLVSRDFPDTLRGVIYAEGQFRSVPYLEDATPWQVQYEAIESALYGPYVLPMDVMVFAQQPTTEKVWGKIGGHVFCYQEETQ